MTGAAKKIAIVTGASEGIGAAAAEALGRAGFDLALAARGAERLEEVAARLRAGGREVLALPTDLADEDETRRLIEATVARFGGFDVLVNNAGYTQEGPIELLDRATMRRQFEVNVFAPLQLIALAAPILRERGGGRIINLSSGAARAAVPMAGIYSASKAAIELASDALRVELAPWGIHVVIVIPGGIATRVHDGTLSGIDRLLADKPANPYAARLAHFKANYQKMLGELHPPAVVAEAIARAATEPRPRARYFAPSGGRLQAALLTLLPARVVDGMVAKLLEAPKT
ncbi:MAG: SDR family NAD(P)-dependent oxidoreductase [Myxococcales bacterium]|nr:SDR family NAD(P)-dependent oxidoreductase [Myxococcales bacterium]